MKNALDSVPAGRKTELFGWLTEEGRFAPDIGHLLEVLCEKLTALGVPIARATAHVRTLHPEFRGATRIWRRGESIEIRTTRHGIEFTSDYQNSPIQYIIETGQWLDTILSEATDRHFPILATLRAQGITHYVMAPLIFSNRIVNAMSWATDAPGGFTEADVELFRDFVTAFVPVLEATAVRRIYGELLATYVGRDPGARIMAGAVQRGDVRHLKAAMLLADVRGFSRLTDELPEEGIVELLNAFFDLVVPGVIAGGGDILKYVGDAVFAMFPVTGDDPTLPSRTSQGLGVVRMTPTNDPMASARHQASLVLGSHAMYDTFAVIRRTQAGISPATVGVLGAESVAAEVLVFLFLGPRLLRVVTPTAALAVAASSGLMRWAVMGQTADVAALGLVQPLHGHNGHVPGFVDHPSEQFYTDCRS